MKKLTVTILLGLLLVFSLLIQSNIEGFNVKEIKSYNPFQVFMGNIKEVIFDVTTPYPDEILDKNMDLPLQNFCNVYGPNDDKCGELTDNNCKSSTCCVLLTKDSSNPKCVGGSEQGPTYKTDSDTYYYMNKLYKKNMAKVI